MSAIELSQRPAFNPYARGGPECSVTAGEYDPYQDPATGATRDADMPMDRRTTLGKGGASGFYSTGGGGEEPSRNGARRGSRAVWKSGGKLPPATW